MSIVNFSFTKINAEKHSDKLETFESSTDIKISSITKEKFDSQELLKFTFLFDVKYSNLGNILLEGTVLASDSNEKMDALVEKWKKSKAVSELINDDIAHKVVNTILYESNIKCLELAHSLRLPSHINLPLLKKSS
ncbi:hypothetical protein J4476_00095 [Candidatus Woesearchaeota archaeon]|nr:hypothetical protein [Candidatus Woesearchaeota archaeon]HIH25492.1 hypothetical protein [Nanoarchaeota archaeon]